MEPDETDRTVINALLADGRASAREIAAETGLPAPTVAKRLDALEAADVVEGYEPRVDYEELGYDVSAVFQLSVDGDGLGDLTDRLRDHHRMIAVYEVTGSHDVVAIGKFRDTASLDEEIKTLLTDPAVEDATTAIVLDAVREFEQFPVDAD